MADDTGSTTPRPGAGAPHGADGGGRDPDDVVRRVKEAVTAQALEDPGYRRLALSDPDDAVRRARMLSPGDRLPPGVRLRVVEETADHLFLVLPHVAPPGPPDPDDPRAVLVDRAASDDGFRRRLEADPRAVVEEHFVVDVPDGLRIDVVHETADERVAVLPADLTATLSTGTTVDLEASVWGGSDCKKSFLNSILENLCPTPRGGPASTVTESPDCTTAKPRCPLAPM